MNFAHPAFDPAQHATSRPKFSLLLKEIFSRHLVPLPQSDDFLSLTEFSPEFLQTAAAFDFPCILKSTAEKFLASRQKLSSIRLEYFQSYLLHDFLTHCLLFRDSPDFSPFAPALAQLEEFSQYFNTCQNLSLKGGNSIGNGNSTTTTIPMISSVKDLKKSSSNISLEEFLHFRQEIGENPEEILHHFNILGLSPADIEQSFPEGFSQRLVEKNRQKISIALFPLVQRVFKEKTRKIEEFYQKIFSKDSIGKSLSLSSPSSGEYSSSFSSSSPLSSFSLEIPLQALKSSRFLLKSLQIENFQRFHQNFLTSMDVLLEFLHLIEDIRFSRDFPVDSLRIRYWAAKLKFLRFKTLLIRSEWYFLLYSPLIRSEILLAGQEIFLRWQSACLEIERISHELSEYSSLQGNSHYQTILKQYRGILQQIQMKQWTIEQFSKGMGGDEM